MSSGLDCCTCASLDLSLTIMQPQTSFETASWTPIDWTLSANVTCQKSEVPRKNIYCVWSPHSPHSNSWVMHSSRIWRRVQNDHIDVVRNKLFWQSQKVNLSGEMKNCSLPFPTNTHFDGTRGHECSREKCFYYAQRSRTGPEPTRNARSVRPKLYNGSQTGSAKFNFYDASNSLHKSYRNNRGSSPGDVRNHHACMTNKGIMNFYKGCLLYITKGELGKVDVNLPKHQNVGKVANAAVEIVHVKA